MTMTMTTNTDTPVRASVEERLTRIESRLAQLMLYLKADVYGRNAEGGFFLNLDIYLEQKDDS